MCALSTAHLILRNSAFLIMFQEKYNYSAFIMHFPPILLLPPSVRYKITFGALFLYTYTYIHPLE